MKRNMSLRSLRRRRMMGVMWIKSVRLMGRRMRSVGVAVGVRVMGTVRVGVRLGVRVAVGAIFLAMSECINYILLIETN